MQVGVRIRLSDSELSRDIHSNCTMNISFDVIDNGSAHDWSAVWPYFNTGCVEWLSTNHACFQLANLFIFLSYLAPVGFYGLIYLRLMLAIGSAFFAVWAWIFICAFDVFLWNAFFFLINAVHFIALISSLRPVRFDRQVQQVLGSLYLSSSSMAKSIQYSYN